MRETWPSVGGLILSEGRSKRRANVAQHFQARTPGAGTPKVWGMATMSGPDFNQGRVVCGEVLNISGVIRTRAGRADYFHKIPVGEVVLFAVVCYEPVH